MILEHWTDFDRTAHTLISAETSRDARAIALWDTPQRCCEIEADTLDECLRLYHEHMGWCASCAITPGDAGEKGET